MSDIVTLLLILVLLGVLGINIPFSVLHLLLVCIVVLLLLNIIPRLK